MRLSTHLGREPRFKGSRPPTPQTSDPRQEAARERLAQLSTEDRATRPPISRTPRFRPSIQRPSNKPPACRDRQERLAAPSRVLGSRRRSASPRRPRRSRDCGACPPFAQSACQSSGRQASAPHPRWRIQYEQARGQLSARDDRFDRLSSQSPKTTESRKSRTAPCAPSTRRLCCSRRSPQACSLATTQPRSAPSGPSSGPATPQGPTLD